MFLPIMRERAVSALTGTPDVLEALLGPLSPADPAWDAHPVADRFSLREVMAHLVDYEGFWLDRLTLTRTEDRPEWGPVDPGRLSLEHDYAHSDAAVSLARFREHRATLVDFLKSLAENDWQRVGLMGERGPLTLEEQIALVVIHDGYHTGQIAQWLMTIHR